MNRALPEPLKIPAGGWIFGDEAPPKYNPRKPWPKISVVTPSYSQGRFIEETIRSVLMQGYPNLEYIVIDGGSKDETVEILEHYDDHITSWVSEPDKGQTNAINKGFQRATGDILAWLNSDDVYLPGTLKTVAEIFLREPATHVLTGMRKYYDADSNFKRNLIFWTPETDVLRRACVITQETTFWRRGVWAAIGELDESYDFAMDYEYWQRMLAHGYEFRFVPRYFGGFREYPEAKTSSMGQVRARDLARIYQRYEVAENEEDAFVELVMDVIGYEYLGKARLLRDFGQQRISNIAWIYAALMWLLKVPGLSWIPVYLHRIYRGFKYPPPQKAFPPSHEERLAEDKLRVLVITNYYPPLATGGYELRCQSLVEHFKARGHHVHVLVGKHWLEKLTNRLEEDGIERMLPYTFVKLPKWKQPTHHMLLDELAARNHVNRVIKQFAPDVIYIWNMWYTPLTATFAAERSRYPVVHQIDHNWQVEYLPEDIWLRRYNALARWKRALLWPLLKTFGLAHNPRQLRNQEMVFISQYRADEHTASDLPYGNIRVIETAVEQATQRERTDFDHLRLIFAARFLIPEKGVREALQATLRACNRGANVSLAIYGEKEISHADYNRELDHLTEQLGEVVTFHGLAPHDQIRDLYSQYDALLFASNFPEGMPLVIAEAYACGIPVIGTPAGGAAEMLDPAASVTVPMDDVAAMTDAILALAADPDRWRDLQAGAQRLSADRFSIDRWLDETEAVLRDAMRRK